ncbi:hypothetical protein DUNSADRAFT_16941 [Dunaliella salina]|uniref:Uncharacterized protein n=1 Tax=Dunaliella salina TaxID=3046 RepID=A0ABQ7H0L5_DUNSA|nr:hypothetical protein DUNSADRAFT_16941 [Dunaliella salina]|eukprot:KAF5840393.1 hypothetical protein DUNSADRAFT_16941 [Dunaliella salina]
MVFEAEIDRLRQGVTHQSATMDTHAQLTWQLQTDLHHAKAQAQRAMAEVEEVRRQSLAEADRVRMQSQAEADAVRRQSQAEIQAAKAEAEACKRQAQLDAEADIRKALADAEGSRAQLEAQLAADVAAARAESEDYCKQLDKYRQDLQAQAQADIQTAMAALDEAEERAAAAEARAAAAQAQADDAESQKDSVIAELQNIAAQVDDVAARQENQGKTQADLMAALVASKARLSEMHALEGLYCEARDELERLDKENLELRDMWQSGVAELGRSRILEGLPAGSHSLLPDSLLPAYTGTKKSAKGKKKNGWIQEYMSDGGMPARSLPGSSPSSLPDMAYLGPSSRMYPPDPDSFVYVRVGGGYDPKHVGTEELPKASGWVPKDVVKVVQAFRHAYKLHYPDWVAWEPLLLLIDEVYRAYQKRLPVPFKPRVPANMAPQLQLPHVVQSSRIAGLKRQLENMRRSLGMRSSRDTNTLKKIAEKEYHLTRQLDEAIEQNVQLRRAVSQLNG